ncbi:hypothetical protein DICVIV_13805 [Dictyocaulus viviparus]|uniref:Uncharacterized protein n=1 Tax=Dictyocaulus viviparus TaxID=29172 RepID=A0A0D8X9F3_DICVI|nr:hypothetical protein DICVIV_13805 [Dictyocaulus viviparus]
MTELLHYQQHSDEHLREDDNAIMANWSTQIWQNILNRVMRSLSSGAFSTNLIGATVMIA